MEELQAMRCGMNGEIVDLVDARNLYSFLEIQQEFPEWIETQLNSGLLDKNDYFVSNPESGDSARTKYTLKIDAAIQVTMLSGSPLSRSALDFFYDFKSRIEKSAEDNSTQIIQLDVFDASPPLLRNRLCAAEVGFRS